MRASQEYGKNPITGEGHTSWDEADCDLDGRKGFGSRGASGNRKKNFGESNSSSSHNEKTETQKNAEHCRGTGRNVITGEG